MNAKHAMLSLLSATLAIATAGAAAAAPADRQQLRKITVAIIGVDATAQAMYAKHRGFFERQGLDVEITVVADGTQTVPAVLSGQAQFAAIPVPGLAALKANGGPVRGVAGGAVYEPGTLTTVLMAGPRSQVRRARDLRGKRVAIDFRNSIAHIAFLRWLKRAGVPQEDVDVSFIPFPQMIGPLVRGQLDVAWLPEPFATVARQRGARVIALPFDAVCSSDCLLTMWMARRDIDPQVAARFRNAVQAAAVWANQKRNQAESGRILARYAPVSPAVRARMARFSYATRLRLRMGQPWLDLYREFNLIPASFTVADLVK
jgi:NitT/TauT family transport system substrate-binding protein